MNKKNVEKKLPKFQAVTLGPDELRKVTGGMLPGGCGTAGTKSICHIDGTDDND